MDKALVSVLCSNMSRVANATSINELQVNSNTTESDLSNTSNDPLLYIITVLMFYALSMTVLMVKYIRREKQEAEFSNYYHEYVSRDRFHTPQYQNSQHIKNIMKVISERKDSRLNESTFDTTDTEQLLPSDDVSRSETNNIVPNNENYRT